MTLELAVEAFAKGFALAKSIASPYVAVRSGPLWILRDGVGRGRGSRLSEVVALSLPPTETFDLLGNTPLGRYALCVVEPTGVDFERVRLDHLALGFRLMSRQPVFVAPTGGPAVPDSRIERVQDAELAGRIAKIAQRRQILKQDLEGQEPARRLFAAIVEGEPAGWVSSIKAVPGANWVANLFVRPEFRRMGLGGALMRALLDDDSRVGIPWSVLLSSQAGAHLHPRVGYVQIGLLQLFAPPKDRQVDLRREAHANTMGV